MSDETFQGRTNMETWDIAAVADNDRPLYDAVTRILEAHPEGGIALADALKDYFERKLERSDGSARLLRDQLVSTALSRADWRDLAQGWHDEREGRVA